MALIHCDFFSDVLGLSCSMCVVLPQKTEGQVGMKGRAEGDRHPVLWLLHGMSDDHTIWQRRTSIERYVAPLGLAVVMPAVNRSCYTDMASGPKYWTFISEELPKIARSFFPLSDKREENFVAGLSMGGYGAFKLGLRCPEQYAAAASLSGAIDMGYRIENDPDEDAAWRHEKEMVYGDLSEFKGSDNDLLHVAEELVASGKPIPAMYACCGTEDFLYEQNVRFRDFAKKIGLELTYEEGPGEHEWGFWDKWIQRVLEWLPLEG